MPNPPPTLRDELRTFRAAWGLSSKSMAAELNISTKTLYRFEDGKCPNPRLLRLALRGLAGELARAAKEEE